MFPRRLEGKKEKKARLLLFTYLFPESQPPRAVEPTPSTMSRILPIVPCAAEKTALPSGAFAVPIRTLRPPDYNYGRQQLVDRLNSPVAIYGIYNEDPYY